MWNTVLYRVRQWIGRFCNTGADAAIAILLPTLKRFSCNGVVDWSTTCFCCESVLQKRWQFCDRPAWILKRGRDSSQSCCFISPCHQDLGSKLRGYWFYTGSVKTVRTPGNIAVVREAIERSPHRSARRNSVTRAVWSQRSTDFTQRSSLIPLQNSSTHALHERDYVNRVNFCQTFFQLINQNQELVNNLLMSDEAHCHLSGFVNKQNFRYWSATNPIELHDRPLHSSKIREKGL